MLAGDTVETSLADHFTNPDCLEGKGPLWEARSSDLSAVAVSVSHSAVLTTAALDMANSVLVTMAFHISLEELSHEFLVRVRPHPTGR